MEQRFRDKGYSRECIEDAKIKTRSSGRDTLLVSNLKPSEVTNPIRFITTYNYQSAAVRKILATHWNSLGCDPSLEDVIGKNPNVIYRRGRNLKDRLCSNLDFRT